MVDVLVTLVALFTPRTTVATTTALLGARVHTYFSRSGWCSEQLGVQRDVGFSTKEWLKERGAEVIAAVIKKSASRCVYEGH